MWESRAPASTHLAPFVPCASPSAIAVWKRKANHCYREQTFVRAYGIPLFARLIPPTRSFRLVWRVSDGAHFGFVTCQLDQVVLLDGCGTNRMVTHFPLFEMHSTEITFLWQVSILCNFLSNGVRRGRTGSLLKGLCIFYFTSHRLMGTLRGNRCLYCNVHSSSSA